MPVVTGQRILNYSICMPLENWGESGGGRGEPRIKMFSIQLKREKKIFKEMSYFHCVWMFSTKPGVLCPSQLAF